MSQNRSIGEQRHEHDLLREFVEEGCEDAFSELVELHAGMVHGVARRKLRDQGEAEDVVQRVFILLAKKAYELRKTTSLGAWLHRAAIFESLKVLREHRYRKEREEKMKEQWIMNGEEKGIWDEVVPHLDEAFDHLGVKDREVLMLRFVEGRSFAEVGQQVKASADAARKRSERALERLAGLLRRRGVVVPAAVLMSGFGSEVAKATPVGMTPAIVKESLATIHANGGIASGSLLTNVMTTMQTGKTITMATALIAATLPVGLEIARAASDKEAREARSTSIASDEHRMKNSREKNSTQYRRLNREQLRKAFQKLEDSKEGDEQVTLKLRRLIFTLDEGELEIARELLDEVQKYERFSEIALAVYARWAELSPDQAIAEAFREKTRFGDDPLRGAFGTWAQMEPKAAMKWLTSIEDSPFEVELLATEWLRREVNANLEGALRKLEVLKSAKPEWADYAQDAVLYEWTQISPEAALAWLEENLGEADRDQSLAKWISAVGDKNPDLALKHANKVESIITRVEALHSVLWSWGRNRPDELIAYLKESEDLGQWEPKLLHVVGKSLSVNRLEEVMSLTREMESGIRKSRFLDGILSAARYGNPAILVEAADGLSDDYVKHENNGWFQEFTRRWVEQDAAAAEQWVGTLPKGTVKRRYAENLLNKVKRSRREAR